MRSGTGRDQIQGQPQNPMAIRSTLMSRNVTVADHRTSVRLEPEMWAGINEIGRRECQTLHQICTSISKHKHEKTSLTAAIRVFIMTYFRVAATEDGHTKAGHGPQLSTGMPSNAEFSRAPLAHTARVQPLSNKAMPARPISGNLDRPWRY